MKRSEEVNLNQQIEIIALSAKKYKTFKKFYNHIDKLPVVSIQDLSFENDISFFKELQFILSVILSIIAKPHLNNKRDEIIARSGEVSSLSEEDFQKTLRDSSIWKDNGSHKLLPEYVYYHTYEDEIKIYENIFIVSLLNEISFIIDHYSSLYVSLLNVADKQISNLVMDDSLQEKALDQVNYLSRRMSQIKETYFYKEVSRAKHKPKVFYPTNILLKDRLYNICFKFYKKLHIYEDENQLKQSLFSYYFILILKKFHQYNFTTTEDFPIFVKENRLPLSKDMIFTNKNNKVEILIDQDQHVCVFKYINKNDIASTHKLYVSEDSTFQDVIVDSSNDTFTTEYISPWHLGEAIKGKIYIENESLFTESQMIDNFFNGHHYAIDGSENIYSSYCPSCKNKGPVLVEGFYHCPDCGAIYRFSNEKRIKGNIIFARLGRKY